MDEEGVLQLGGALLHLSFCRAYFPLSPIRQFKLWGLGIFLEIIFTGDPRAISRILLHQRILGSLGWLLTAARVACYTYPESPSMQQQKIPSRPHLLTRGWQGIDDWNKELKPMVLGTE